MSEVTVRRDLEQFETDREEIARVAFLMVHDGDVLMLTNGAIARVLARKLGERSGLTVLTTNIAFDGGKGS